MKKISLFNQIWQFVNKYKMFNETAHILIAFSSGPDSLALTLLLLEIKSNYCPNLKLHLAHLNHLLRGEESQRDELFARNFATNFNLALTTDQIDVAKLAKGANLEATARDIRYKFLQQTANQIGADYITTAHNMNDQAETFLMRLIRGAAITGLSGIKPILRINDSLEEPRLRSVPVIRPLLNTKRSTIENYLREKDSTACIDSSNFSTKLTRNKIRLEILPKILEINPKAIETISRTTDILREWQETIGSSQNKIVNNEIRFSIDALLELPEVLRHQQLRNSIEQLAGKIHRLTAKHIFSVDTLLVVGKSGKKVLLPNGLEVAREFDQIIIRHATPTTNDEEKNNISFDLCLGGEWVGGIFTIFYKEINKLEKLNYPKDMFAVLDLDKTGERLKIRFREAGDKYLPARHKNEEKLKRLMLESRIPLSQRSTWPIITSPEDKILWAPRLPVAAEFAANSKSSRFAIIVAKC